MNYQFQTLIALQRAALSMLVLLNQYGPGPPYQTALGLLHLHQLLDPNLLLPLRPKDPVPGPYGPASSYWIDILLMLCATPVGSKLIRLPVVICFPAVYSTIQQEFVILFS